MSVSKWCWSLKRLSCMFQHHWPFSKNVFYRLTETKYKFQGVFNMQFLLQARWTCLVSSQEIQSLWTCKTLQLPCLRTFKTSRFPSLQKSSTSVKFAKRSITTKATWRHTWKSIRLSSHTNVPTAKISTRQNLTFKLIMTSANSKQIQFLLQCLIMLQKVRQVKQVLGHKIVFS